MNPRVGFTEEWQIWDDPLRANISETLLGPLITE
jgi:hypothetical protein